MSLFPKKVEYPFKAEVSRLLPGRHLVTLMVFPSIPVAWINFTIADSEEKHFHSVCTENGQICYHSCAHTHTPCCVTWWCVRSPPVSEQLRRIWHNNDFSRGFSTALRKTPPSLLHSLSGMDRCFLLGTVHTHTHTRVC